MNDSRAQAVGVRYYGELAEGRNDMIVNAVLVGLFKPILSSGVTMVNARSVAADRGIEVDRVAQLPAAQLHEPALAQAAHERRRAVGGRRRVRAHAARGSCWSTASTSRRRSRGR